jgi:hypothetical protein
MVYFLQRECNSATEIAVNSIVRFETAIALSETDSSSPSEDFVYHADGSIDILRPGIYITFWHVVAMTGLSTNGQSYQLKKFDYDAVTPDWIVLAESTNHIKVSSTPGFNTLIVSKAEITEHGKATVALFNTADSDVRLTVFRPKAGILVFGLDLSLLESRIKTIETEIVDIERKIKIIEDFIYLSDISRIWTPTVSLSGIGAAVIHSGHTYNFWGIGALDHTQTLSNGTTYYIMRSNQYEELLLYQGDTTIGTLWIETPSGNVYSFPIRFDETGIYFIPNSQLTNLPVGTTFKFTQALILAEIDEDP